MNEHLGSPPRSEVGNRILVFVPIAVNGPECDHHVQHNRACMVIIQAATATCLHDGALTVTQGTTAACLDCFNLGQLHQHILQIEVALLPSLWYHKRNHWSKTRIHLGIEWLARVDQGKISLEGMHDLIWLNDVKNIPHAYGVLCMWHEKVRFVHVSIKIAKRVEIHEEKQPVIGGIHISSSKLCESRSPGITILCCSTKAKLDIVGRACWTMLDCYQQTNQDVVFWVHIIIILFAPMNTHWRPLIVNWRCSIETHKISNLHCKCKAPLPTKTPQSGTALVTSNKDVNRHKSRNLGPIFFIIFHQWDSKKSCSFLWPYIDD